MRHELRELASKEIEEAASSYQKMADRPQEVIEAITSLVDASVATIREGKIVAFCGNGGSFADAQHMSAELTGKLNRDRKPLPAIVLGSNSSSISAIGNDFGYQFSFARELEALSDSIGVVVGFSTSGNSENILQLGKVAQLKSVPFFCFTGKNIGSVEEFAVTISVPSSRTERIQELHTTLGHIYCQLLEEELGIF